MSSSGSHQPRAPLADWVSRVALISVYRHAVVITPVARWVLIARGSAYSSLAIPPRRRRPSPSLCRVGVHIGRFEACSTFTHVTACRLAASPKRYICLEGSDGFVFSTAAPIATGWSGPVARRELHPLKTNTFPRRTKWLAPSFASFADPLSLVLVHGVHSGHRTFKLRARKGSQSGNQARDPQMRSREKVAGHCGQHGHRGTFAARQRSSGRVCSPHWSRPPESAGRRWEPTTFGVAGMGMALVPSQIDSPLPHVARRKPSKVRTRKVRF